MKAFSRFLKLISAILFVALTVAAQWPFDPSGYYYLKDPFPKGFENFSHVTILRRDKQGRTALSLAEANHNAEVVKALKQAGAKH